MVAIVLFLLLTVTSAFGAAMPAGFHFMEGVTHTSISFKLYKNLIIIPARLNDTLTLNLILDTGTRSVLLYGKKFKGLKSLLPDKKIQVSGWGSGESVDALLAHPNDVSIGGIRGHEIGIAVVTGRKLFSEKQVIDGLIGYDLFVRFAVEINYRTQTIHLYDKISSDQTIGFTSIPLEVSLSRPQVKATVRMPASRSAFRHAGMANNCTINMNLLIDTGSSLGLIVFSKTKEGFSHSGTFKTIGLGLSGFVFGSDLHILQLLVNNMPVENVSSHLVYVQNHPDETFTWAGSLGGSFLKDHIVIFDYPGSRLFLKRIS